MLDDARRGHTHRNEIPVPVFHVDDLRQGFAVMLDNRRDLWRADRVRQMVTALRHRLNILVNFLAPVVRFPNAQTPPEITVSPPRILDAPPSEDATQFEPDASGTQGQEAEPRRAGDVPVNGTRTRRIHSIADAPQAQNDDSS